MCGIAVVGGLQWPSDLPVLRQVTTRGIYRTRTPGLYLSRLRRALNNEVFRSARPPIGSGDASNYLSKGYRVIGGDDDDDDDGVSLRRIYFTSR